MKLLLVPAASLAVIGAAALLTTDAPPRTDHECEMHRAQIAPRPDLVPLEDAPVIIERHHFAKPPPGPAPTPVAPHAAVTA